MKSYPCLKKGAAFFLSFLLIVSSLSGCRRAETVSYEEKTFYYIDVLDTVCVFTLYLTEDQDADYYKNWIHEELLSYHQLFDAYHEYDGVNNVYTINQNAGKQAIAVDEELFYL